MIGTEDTQSRSQPCSLALTGVACFLQISSCFLEVWPPGIANVIGSQREHNSINSRQTSLSHLMALPPSTPSGPGFHLALGSFTLFIQSWGQIHTCLFPKPILFPPISKLSAEQPLHGVWPWLPEAQSPCHNHSDFSLRRACSYHPSVLNHLVALHCSQLITRLIYKPFVDDPNHHPACLSVPSQGRPAPVTLPMPFSDPQM